MKDVLEPFSDIGAPATACWCACFNFEDSSRSCDEHKAALVAEVRRLRAEVVTLECERAPQELVDHLAAERDAAHAEAERLRGELDAAEGAMADIAGERAEAVAEASRVREALQAARDLHVAGRCGCDPNSPHSTGHCRVCGIKAGWPCATVRALDAALDGAE